MTHSDRKHELPSVHLVVSSPLLEPWVAVLGRSAVVSRCRQLLHDMRSQPQAHAIAPEISVEQIARTLARRLQQRRDDVVQRVVNATGIVLHTNLGRAVLPDEAVDAVRIAAAFPCDLEYDRVDGRRGRREAVSERLLQDLTGAPAATIVNNNAAAVMLAVNTFSRDREVIVSRGELIEIGGAFRLPEIITSSGGLLKEVGTTNRTTARDYEQAIGPRTGMILKAHKSNYVIDGFVAEATITELGAIGRAKAIPVVEDLGSGSLVDLQQYGLPQHARLIYRSSEGADVLMCSADKIIGGPQAGIVCGRADLIEVLRRNPLHRAVRCGKLPIAALQATLGLYWRGGSVNAQIPTLSLLTRPLTELQHAAGVAVALLARALGPSFSIEILETVAFVGSGALPQEKIRSAGVSIRACDVRVNAIAERFRNATPSIVGRVQADAFILDMICIADPADVVPVAFEGPCM